MTLNSLLRPQIYGFAFGNMKTVLYKTHEIDSCYLVFGESSISKYLDYLVHDQPTFILGLGVYSGVDQDKIRIETICTNQFRNDYLDMDGLVINQIPRFIGANESMKLSRGIGNSWCNFISWRITSLIKEDALNSTYTFLHIPKTLNPLVVAKQIDEVLTGFRKEYNEEN